MVVAYENPVANSDDKRSAENDALLDASLHKKVPDEEHPSLLGNPPDALGAPLFKDEADKDFLDIHNDKELVHEPRKADDGLL